VIVGSLCSDVGDRPALCRRQRRQAIRDNACDRHKREVKSLLTEQVGVRADRIGVVAASAKVAAESLEPHASQLANLVGGASERVDEFSREICGQTIEQIARRTSDFARARSAVMSGAAATCGFFLYRLFNAGSYGHPRQHSAAQDHREWQPGGNRYPLTDVPPISARYGQSHGA
jgi:hypothetical protein